MRSAPSDTALVEPILDWYAENARDLPWRRPGVGAWPIMVSEFMLQQTPVSRVLEPWRRWLARWPTPIALADAPAGEAVREWGRLGYPRRALRLHRAATVVADHHGGVVPSDYDQLLALPGVGAYTAAAIASFAYGQRHVVLDTNVRRVIARTTGGRAHPDRSPSVAERATAAALVPADPARAARWAVASMELGAVVCTARVPHCDVCPVHDHCAWRRLGHPAWDGAPRVGQSYDGTDRQCRGALLAVLRATDVPVSAGELDLAWPDAGQRDRALVSLLTDGLVVATTDPSGNAYALPS